MERESRHRFGAHALRVGGAALALALLAAGCGSRLQPGQVGEASYSIGGWQAVGEERVGRTLFQYTLRGTCSNTGADAAGAAGLVISRSPHTVVVEDQIRCGPLARGHQAPSLDTITVQHDRSQPFDPKAITGITLVWGPETLERETRVDRTHFDYQYYAYLVNGTDAEQDVIATVASRSADLSILDDTVTGRIPARRRLASTDRFSFRHDRASPYDPNALEWRLRLGALGASADLDRDGDVDADDRARAEGCVAQDPRRACDCARADLDGDGDVDAADVALVIAQLGRTGLPVPPPDATPPAVVVTEPAAGSTPGAPPIPVSGTASEPLFLLLVNGVAAAIGSGDPLPWSAQAPLAPGGARLVVATLQVPLAGADTTAPQVAIVAPREVAAGRALRVAVDAQDAGEVADVELFADGASAGARGAPPYLYDLVAPPTPGAALALRAVARDAAGNTGEASASVAVMDEGLADAPPRVTALRLPASAARGAAVLVGADAADDRGVAEVRFSLAGGGAASDPTPPYEALLPVPADAPLGARLRVDAVAVDGAGQTAAASGELTVVAAADTSPPVVSLSAPATAAPGPPVALSATASDDGGVASVRFLADGVPVAEDAEAPFAASVPLPEGRAPGEIVIWTARARDFAGNQAESDPAVTRVVAPGGGFAVGEVYDDATSRPLAGARVQVLEAAGAPPPAPLEAQSDARGAWRLPLAEGRVLLRVEREGYTGAWREAQVPASGAVAPLDARLTARAAPRALARSEGGTVLAPGGAARVEVPIGALAADGPVGLTALGAQSLPLPLPLGWSPVAAFELDAPGGLAAPVSLVLVGEAARATPLAARFDPQARAWRRLAIDAGDPALPRVALAAPGTVVLARPDAAPAAPPVPEPGATLTGVGEVPLPAGASLELLPSPRVVFVAPDARAEVAARLAAAVPLPSGTPIEVRFREAYRQRDGSRLAPEGSAQDFLLYAEAEGPTARFAATPLPGLDPVLLDEGAIDLAAGPRSPAGPALIGPEGGAAATPEGVRVELPPGALAGPTPIGVTRVAAPDLGLPADARFAPLGGFDLDLGGASLASAALLRFPLSESPAAGDQILLVRAITVQGRSELELVGLATPDGAGVLVGAGGLGLPLPGVRAGGRYALVRLAAPAGFVTGVVARAGAPAGETLVRADTLPFVSWTRAGAPDYAVAAGLGPARVGAIEIATGATGAAEAPLAAAGEVAQRSLVLVPQEFRVTAVAPPAGDRAVPVGSAVVVSLSGVVDRTSLTDASVSLTAGGAPVAVRVTLAADGRGLVARPVAALVGGAEHAVRVDGGLRDVLGRTLAGGEADGSFHSTFVAATTTPPPRPAPGQITLSIPRDGTTEVRGTPGSVEPGDLVSVWNRTRGTTTGVLASDDGSFFATLDAGPGDEVVIVISNPDGTATFLDPIPFSDPDGTTLLGPRGGSLSSAAGVRASLLPGALRSEAEVRVVDLDVAALAALPPDVGLVRAFRLEATALSFNAVAQLEVLEEAGRFPARSAFSTPYRIVQALLAPPTIGAASRLDFAARLRDARGTLRAASLRTAGSASPCSASETVRSEAEAPRLRLTGPSCVGASQSFELLAEAIEPRFDLSVPASGAGPGETHLLLREDGARWALEDLGVAAGDRVESASRTPFGVRTPGAYALVRALAPLGFVEGVAAGAPVAVGAEGSPLVSLTGAANGPFLAALPAGSAAVLAFVPLSGGATLATLPLAPLGAGETRALGLVGPEAPAALEVTASLGEGAAVAPTAALVFSFSEPLDPASATPAQITVTDARDRAVEGALALGAGERSVQFRPQRPWRVGETYRYRVGTGVLARSGARLPADAVGSFAGFTPGVRATVAGTDVVDALAVGTAAYAIDGGALRSLDLADPDAPGEGRPLGSTAPATRLARAGGAAGADGLLLSTGSATEYGRLARVALGDPLAPAELGALRLSTPSGAPAVAGVPTQTGVPEAAVRIGERAVVASRGLGLQSVAFGALTGSGAAGLVSFPAPGQSPETFARIASAGGRLLSIGARGLAEHRLEDLAPLATAGVEGTPADLAAAAIAGRTIALVAAGLPGGVQAFEVGEAGLRKVARVLTGCAATRVAIDPPFARGWVACSNGRLFPLDLAQVDGLEPIDRDGDGADDRLGGSFELGVTPRALALDDTRSLGLVAAGPAGLQVIQLGPAEAAVADLVRDPIDGAHQDEESIRGTGRAFFGDRRLRLVIEARIPAGHPGLRAVALGSGGAGPPVLFAGGAAESVLAGGRNELALEPRFRSGSTPSPFEIRVVDAAGTSLAALGGSIEPVPLAEITSAQPVAATIDAGPGPAPITIRGRSEDGRVYDLTPVTQFEVERGAVGAVVDGSFAAAAGGETRVVFTVGSKRGTVAVRSLVPPAPERIEVEPPQLFLAAPGAAQPLSVVEVLTDGTRQPLPASTPASFTSGAPAVASVDGAGRVRAEAEGAAEIRVEAGGLATSVFAHVRFFVAPVLSEVALELAESEVATDRGTLSATAWVRGTGSLENLPVTFALTGLPGGPREVEVRTDPTGLAVASFVGLGTPGAATLLARVTDPAGGATLEDSLPIAVVGRNLDAEPNGSLASASPATAPGELRGALGAGDASDVYRAAIEETGVLAARVSVAGAAAAPVRVAIRSAAGAVLAEAQAAAGVAEAFAAVAPEAAFLEVSGTGAAEYALALGFEPDLPAITRIVPASAPGGSEVVIEGSGFHTTPARNVVFFAGTLATVLEASPSALRVVVPALASDGPVTVHKGEQASNEVAFATGATGSLADRVPVEPMAPIESVEDPLGTGTVVRRQLLVRFEPSATPSAVAALAAARGGRIVGVFAAANEYLLEFAAALEVGQLDTVAEQLEEDPLVVYAGLVDRAEPSAFRIGTRDDFFAETRGAWDQVRATAAWEAIADSGFYGRVADFRAVAVGVVDNGHNPNPNNAAQFPANRFRNLSIAAACTSDPACAAIVQPGCPAGSTCPVAIQDSHGTPVSGIIGAANVARVSTGMLGGVLGSAVTDTFYRIVSTDAHYEDDAFNIALTIQAFALLGSAGVQVINYSGGGIHLPPGAPVRLPELAAICSHPTPSAAPTCATTAGFATNAAHRAAREALVRARRAERRDDELQYWGARLDQVPGALLVVAAGNDNRPVEWSTPAALTVLPVPRCSGTPRVCTGQSYADRVMAVAAVGQGLGGQGGTNGCPSGPGQQICLQKLQFVSDLAAGNRSDLGADARTVFSNYGPGTDIAAPGIHVLAPDGTLVGGAGLQGFRGTSAAAPMVAGAAALLLALDPDQEVLGSNGVKALLIDTATPIGDVPPGTATRFGGGPVTMDWGGWSEPRRLDVLAAVQRVLARRAAAAGVADDTWPFAPGRKRFSWLVDSQTNRLVRIQYLPGFEEDPTQFRVRSEDVSGRDCAGPVALASAPSGDKVYVACRESSNVLVWNANRMRPVRVGDGSPGLIAPWSIPLPNPPAPGRPRMAMSPNGDFLLVPLEGQRVAKISVRSDRLVQILRFKPGAGLRGELRALAFDSGSRLLAVSSEPGTRNRLDRGTLVRAEDPMLDRGPSFAVWSTDSVDRTDIEQTTGQELAFDEPAGLTVRRVADEDLILVHYAGSDGGAGEAARATATVHSPPSLAQVGMISNRVEGRPASAPTLIPGSVVPLVAPAESGVERTGTQRVFDLVLDGEDPSRGYSLYYFGAGLGLFDASRPFTDARPLAAVAGFEGRFSDLVQTVFTLDHQQDGQVDLNATPTLREGQFYSQELFPTAFDLDQEGTLLTTAIAGTPGRLRVYMPRVLQDVARRLRAGEFQIAYKTFTPADRVLDDLDPFGPRVYHDLDPGFEITGPKDVLAGPQLAVLLSSPLSVDEPDEGLRGVLEVQLAVRDPEIREIVCTVQRCPEGGACTQVSTTSGGALDGALADLGIAYRLGPPAQPICRFVGLPRGELVLEVIGKKADGVRRVTVRRPFRYAGDAP